MNDIPGRAGVCRSYSLHYLSTILPSSINQSNTLLFSIFLVQYCLVETYTYVRAPRLHRGPLENHAFKNPRAPLGARGFFSTPIITITTIWQQNSYSVQKKA